MANKKVAQVEKLADTSLENVVGGQYLSCKTKRDLQTCGEIASAVGFLGFATCIIASDVCGSRNAKNLRTAADIFMGVTALGGATYSLGRLG